MNSAPCPARQHFIVLTERSLYGYALEAALLSRTSLHSLGVEASVYPGISKARSTPAFFIFDHIFLEILADSAYTANLIHSGHKFIALLETIDPRYLQKDVTRGHVAYLSTRGTLQDIENAIIHLDKHEPYIDPLLKPELSERKSYDLGEQDYKILDNLARNNPVKDIAKIIALSPSTIRARKAKLAKRLNSSNDVFLGAELVRQRLID